MATSNPTSDTGRPTGTKETKNAGTSGSNSKQGTPDVSQTDLANSDGAGIRGDYGDAEQTNGLEGGQQQPTDAAPDRADRNPTNAAR